MKNLIVYDEIDDSMIQEAQEAGLKIYTFEEVCEMGDSAGEIEF